MKRGVVGTLFLLASVLLTASASAQTAQWSGDVNADWYDAANWKFGVPSATVSALLKASTSGNDPLIPSIGADVFDLDIQASGTLNFAPDATLTVHGTGQMRNNGTVNLDGGSIVFLNDVTLLNGGTFNAETGTVVMNGGTWENSTNAIFDPGTSTVVFSGTSDQTLTGDITFYNLEVNTFGTLTISGNISIINTLTVSSSSTILLSGTSTLTVNGTLINSGTITGTGALSVTVHHYELVAATPQTVGIPFAVNVIAKDAVGSTITLDNSTIVTMSSSTGTVQFDGNGDGTYGDNTKTLSGGTFTIWAKDDIGGTVTLTASDPNNKSGSLQVTINRPPVANAQSVTTDEDASVAITLAGTDPDGNPLSYRVEALPLNGSLTGSAPALTYIPNLNYSGGDFFTFSVNDGIAGSSPATVSISVNAVNDAPVSVSDAATTDAGSDVEIDVLANDTDVDNLNVELSVASVTAGPGGTPVVLADGRTVRFTPDLNFSGMAGFSYRAKDPAEAESNDGSVTVVVNALNSSPTATAKSMTTDEDLPKAIALEGADIDGDALTFTIASDPLHGTLSNFNSVTGEVTYMPSLDYHGSDSFTFTVTDGLLASDPATVTITVTPVNDIPIANGLSVTTDEDTPRSITLSGEDIDGDVLTFEVVTPPLHGSLGGSAPNLLYRPAAHYFGMDRFTFRVSDGVANSVEAEVIITIDSVNDLPVLAAIGDRSTDEDTPLVLTLSSTDVDGGSPTFSAVSGTANVQPSVVGSQLTLVPSANWNGMATITVSVTDGEGGIDSETFTLTVNPVNDAPLAVDDAVATSVGAAVDIDVLANDIDVDNANAELRVSAVAEGVGGTPTVLGDGRTVRFTPGENFSGVASFTYTVKDAGDAVSNSASVRITVRMTNRAPEAFAQAVVMNEDTPRAVTLSGSDADGDVVTFAVVSNPTHGTLSALNRATGAVTYTPDANFHGSDSFSFRVSDGSLFSSPATVSVTVAPVNDRPVADRISITTDEDMSKWVMLSGSDVDGDVLTFIVVSSPLHGSLSGEVPGVTYTPLPNYFGSDLFMYRVSDGIAYSIETEVNITINPVNDPPVLAAIGNRSTDEDTPLVLNLSSTDVDGGSPAFSGQSSTTNVQISSSANELMLIPLVNWNGTSGITVTVSDGQGGSDFEAFMLTVLPVNDPPEGQAQSVTTDEDTPLRITLAGSDVDGDIVTFNIATHASHGTLSVLNRNTGAVVYTPSGNFNGSDSFGFTVSDGALTSTAAIVSIAVSGVNDAPVVLQVPPIQFDEDTQYAFDLDEYARDADNTLDELTWTANFGTSTTGQSGSGAVRRNVRAEEDAPLSTAAVIGLENGQVHRLLSSSANSDIFVSIDPVTHVATITSASNFYGSDIVLEFTATDPGGRSSSSITSVSVLPVNDPPSSFRLISPVTGSIISSPSVTLTWEPSTDVEGTGIIYTVYLSSIGLETVVSGLTNTQLTVLDLNLETTYTWYVAASDGELSTRSQEIFTFTTSAVTRTDEEAAVPERYAVSQNYPNPFNPATTIRYDVPERSRVILVVYDDVGRHVVTLLDEEKEAGRYEVGWDGRNDAGHQVGSGVYFYRLFAGSGSGDPREPSVEAKKMILLK